LAAAEAGKQDFSWAEKPVFAYEARRSGAFRRVRLPRVQKNRRNKLFPYRDCIKTAAERRDAAFAAPETGRTAFLLCFFTGIAYLWLSTGENT